MLQRTLNSRVSSSYVYITKADKTGFFASSACKPKDVIYYFFIYLSIHINNKKIETINVRISTVWTKWPTQGQATYVPPQHYSVFQKSDAKIEIIITAINLIRIKCPLSSCNYHLSGANVANFNKIHCTVFEQQLFKNWS